MDRRIQERFISFVSHVTQLTKEFEREGFLGMPPNLQQRLQLLSELYRDRRYRELVRHVELLLDDLEGIEMSYLERQKEEEHQQTIEETSAHLAGVYPLSTGTPPVHFRFFRRLHDQLHAYNVQEYHHRAHGMYWFFGRLEVVLIVLLGGLLIWGELHAISFFMMWYCVAVLSVAATVILLFRRTKTGIWLLITLLLVLGIVGGWHVLSW